MVHAYFVTLSLFGHSFSCWCGSAHAAIEAIHAAHRTLCPEIGPAALMTVGGPEWEMYTDLAVKLPAMMTWPEAKRLAGISLLGGTIVVQCLVQNEEG